MVDMLKTEKEPTETGKRKYPPDGYRLGTPCTCEQVCDYDCKGECGCEACHESWMDFLSSE